MAIITLLLMTLFLNRLSFPAVIERLGYGSEVLEPFTSVLLSVFKRDNAQDGDMSVVSIDRIKIDTGCTIKDARLLKNS